MSGQIKLQTVNKNRKSKVFEGSVEPKRYPVRASSRNRKVFEDCGHAIFAGRQRKSSQVDIIVNMIKPVLSGICLRVFWVEDVLPMIAQQFSHFTRFQRSITARATDSHQFRFGRTSCSFQRTPKYSKYVFCGVKTQVQSCC